MKCTRKVTDKGSDGHSGTSDLSWNLYFVHRCKEDRTHTEYTGTDGQRDCHTENDAHILVGQECVHSQNGSYDHEYDLKVFGCGMKNFVRDDTANRIAKHFQTILVNDSVHTH